MLGLQRIGRKEHAGGMEDHRQASREKKSPVLKSEGRCTGLNEDGGHKEGASLMRPLDEVGPFIVRTGGPKKNPQPPRNTPPPPQRPPPPP